MAVPLLLAGCSSYSSSSLNPVNWYHHLEGGEIAQQRPPPPGSNAPYPNLATVPAKPAVPDQAELEKITQGLVADRAHAEYMAAAAPIADPSSPQASPSLFGTGTMPPPPPPGAPVAAGSTPASASLAAASGPPPSPAPAGPAPKPLPAPRGPVQSAPLPALAGAAPAVPPPGTTGTGAPPAPPTVAAGPVPQVPATPPPPPSVPGAPPVKVASATPPASAMPQPGAITIEFVAGSSDLPPGANDLLKELAATRGNGVIAVTGHGDVGSDDPAAQVTGLNLGLARAQAAAKALASDGVPTADVRVGAEAAGRGLDARLIQ